MSDLSVLISIHESFVIFSLHHLIEEGVITAALAGTWHPARVNPPQNQTKFSVMDILGILAGLKQKGKYNLNATEGSSLPKDLCSHIHMLTQSYPSRHRCKRPLAQSLCSSVWAHIPYHLHSRMSAF